jgi:hypothetical protein
MQVLYQLSYGPDRTPWHGMLVIPLGLRPCLTLVELTTPPVYSWRQTATSLPCTVTWSAGTTIGA